MASVLLPLLVAGLQLSWVAGSPSFYPADAMQDVHELNPSSYEALIEKGVDASGLKVFHIVKFYSGEGSPKKNRDFAKSIELRPKLVDAAKKLRSTAVMVSAVDCSSSSNAEICAERRFKPKDLPALAVVSPNGEEFPYEGKPKKIVEFIGAKIQKYVSDDLATMMPLLIPKQKAYKSFRKNTDKTRVVLLMESKGAKGKKNKQIYQAFANLALHFSPSFQFGYSKHKKVVKAFGAGSSSLPAVFLVPQGAKFDSARAYTGTLAYRPMKTWLGQFLEEGSLQSKPEVSALPTPRSVDTIPEIQSEGCMQRLCVNRGGICVISLLPTQSLPSGERGYYLESMRLVRRALVDKLGLTPFNAVHVSWLDTSPPAVQDWLEKAFGLPGAEYARTIVWYPKKNVWSQYVGTFSPPDLSKWIVLASRGKATVQPLASEEGKTPQLPTKAEDPSCQGAVVFKEGDGSADADVLAFKDEVVADKFKESMKKKGKKKGTSSSSSSSTGSNSPPFMSSKRLPRPRSKAGKSFDLNAEIFEDNVLKTPSYWLVWFKGGGEDASEAQEAAWNKAARQLKGMVQFGSVNASEKDAIMNQFVLPLPAEGDESASVMLFPSRRAIDGEGEEADKKKAQAASWITDLALEEKAIVDYSLSLLRDSPSEPIYRLDASQGRTLETWFQGGNGPVTARLMLFPSKDLEEPPLLLKALEIEFGQLLQFGLAKKSDAQMSQQFQIQKTPSIIIVAPQGVPKEGEQLQLGIIPYQGHMSFNAIAIHIESMIRPAPASPPGGNRGDRTPKDEL